MAGLQDDPVQQPDSNSSHCLDARQRMAGKKTAQYTQRVKRKTPPQQAGDGSKQVSQRRQMVKNRMQLARLELVFLHEVHDAGDASEREYTIGHERNRSVKLQPWTRR